MSLDYLYVVLEADFPALRWFQLNPLGDGRYEVEVTGYLLDGLEEYLE